MSSKKKQCDNSKSHKKYKNICCKVVTPEKHPILIKCVPYTIASPGSYALAHNLTYTGIGVAITITSANVILDGANGSSDTPYTLTLTNASSTGVSLIGFSATPPYSVSNVIIRNLPILTTATLANNSNIGINLNGADKVLLSNVFLKQVNVGVQLTNVDTVDIIDSRFEDNLGPQPPDEVVFANGINGLGGVINLTVDNSIFTSNQIVAYPGNPTSNGCTFLGPNNDNKNIVFRNCQFVNLTSALDVQQANNVTVENSQIYQDNTNGGIFRAMLFGFLNTGSGNPLVKTLILRNLNIIQFPVGPIEASDGILLIAGNNGLIENVTIIGCGNSASGELDVAALHAGLTLN